MRSRLYRQRHFGLPYGQQAALVANGSRLVGGQWWQQRTETSFSLLSAAIFLWEHLYGQFRDAIDIEMVKVGSMPLFSKHRFPQHVLPESG